MVTAISVVVLFGACVFALCKWGNLKVLHAVLSAAFGFYLAKSALAPYLDRVFVAIFTFLAEW